MKKYEGNIRIKHPRILVLDAAELNNRGTGKMKVGLGHDILVVSRNNSMVWLIF